MSRLIDENDIIKMLNTMDRYTSEELTLCDTDKTFPMNEVFIVDDVFEGLDELPSAQPEQQWIPVTERLPKENKPVIVTHYGKYQAFVSVDWIDPYTSEWNRTCNVTAWQPLPKPWKGGEA